MENAVRSGLSRFSSVPCFFTHHRQDEQTQTNLQQPGEWQLKNPGIAGTQESTFPSNKWWICMSGSGCVTKCSLADDLIIEQIGYNIIASISLFKIKVEMFWFTAAVNQMMMATSSKWLSYRHLVVFIACTLLLRDHTWQQWDRSEFTVCCLVDLCCFPLAYMLCLQCLQLSKRNNSHKGMSTVPQ